MTREIFSFQSRKAMSAMERIKEHYGVSGVCLLSTCNRTELYVSAKEGGQGIFPMLCASCHVRPEDYREYAVERQGKEVVTHLFLTTAGMKSKVFGEDQIISQVRNALFLARDVGTTDGDLEMLFQAAVACAKKIKTNVHLTAVKTSVVEEMLSLLQTGNTGGQAPLRADRMSLLPAGRPTGTERRSSLQADRAGVEETVIDGERFITPGGLRGKHCLVIGNGEIGRLAAARFIKEGAAVTVTVRSYGKRDVEIPKGCVAIDYADRYENIGNYDIIVSATASPHYTLGYEECRELFSEKRSYILVDLAVPRDIPEELGKKDNIKLYNIDSFGGAATSVSDNEALASAMEIVREAERDFFSRMNSKEYAPMIQSIGQFEAELTFRRMEKTIKRVIGTEKADEMRDIVEGAVQKTITSMLFELEKALPSGDREIVFRELKKQMF